MREINGPLAKRAKKKKKKSREWARRVRGGSGWIWGGVGGAATCEYIHAVDRKTGKFSH